MDEDEAALIAATVRSKYLQDMMYLSVVSSNSYMELLEFTLEEYEALKQVVREVNSQND